MLLNSSISALIVVMPITIPHGNGLAQKHFV